MLGACSGETVSSDNVVADKPAPPPVAVDSARPMPVMIERFQTGLARPARLEGSEPSRDALVRRFVRAMETSDTADLRRMLIDRAEYAYLYFPGSTIAQLPYELDPELAWFQMRLENNKGLGKALDVLGGRKLGFLDYACAEPPQRQRDASVFTNCSVRRREGGSVIRQRLFMAIVEIGGRHKFFSYANRL